MTPKIPVPPIAVLLRAKDEKITPNFAKDMLSYIDKGMSPESNPSDSLAYHELNTRF